MSRRPFKEQATIVVPDILPGLLPGGAISMLSGASGTGKTTLLAVLVKKLLAGEGLFGIEQAREIPAIGLICCDRRWQEARIWFDAVGVVQGDRFRVYCLQDDFDLVWRKFRVAENNVPLLSAAIDKLDLPPRGLLLMDPGTPYFGNRINDYNSVFAALGPLNQLVGRKELTAIASNHTPKLKNDPRERMVRPQDRILGSAAIAGYSSTQFYLIGPEETEQDYYIFGYKAHNLKPAEMKLVRDANGLFIPYEGDQRRTAAAREKKVERVEAAVEEVLGRIPIEFNSLNSIYVQLRNDPEVPFMGSKSTLHRWLHKLLENNAVQYDEDTKCYRRLEGLKES